MNLFDHGNDARPTMSETHLTMTIAGLTMAIQISSLRTRTFRISRINSSLNRRAAHQSPTLSHSFSVRDLGVSFLYPKFTVAIGVGPTMTDAQPTMRIILIRP
jgi:hypothetical protein